MSDGWFYKMFGQEFGPLPFDELADLARTDQLSADDEVRQGRLGPWSRADQVPGLFSPAEDEDEAVWYCQLVGMEMGPMPLADVQAMIVHGELSQVDLVRRGTDGEWVAAGTVDELVFDESDEDSPVPTRPDVQPSAEPPIEPAEMSAAADDPPLSDNSPEFPADDDEGPGFSSTDVPGTAVAETAVSESSAVAPALGTEDPMTAGSPPMTAGSPETAGSAPRPHPDSPPSMEAAISKATSPKAPPKPARTGRGQTSQRLDFEINWFLVGALAICLVVLAVLRWPEATRDAEDFEILVSYYGRMNEFRGRGASEAEWDQLSEQAQNEIAPMVERLRRTAGADTPGRQALLYMARDLLIPMIEEVRNSGQDEPGENERDFKTQMERARSHIQQ